MVKYFGIQTIYRAPRPDKHYTTYAEIETNFYEPQIVGCIFHEHPNQRTLKKIGWVSELQAEESLISVPYNLPNLQVGSLFIIPSGIDKAKGRVFRVTAMHNIMIYPASITCVIAPEYEDNRKIAPSTQIAGGVPLLNREEDDE